MIAIALVVLIAIPFFSMRLGSSDQGNDPVGTTTRTAYDPVSYTHLDVYKRQEQRNTHNDPGEEYGTT